MSTIVDSIESRAIRKDRPHFAAGDRVRVHFVVVEAGRSRTQVFEGIVIKRQGSGARETFTVRKQSFGVGVERTFPLHSPKIEKLEIAARGQVRRAKLYYLRDKVGKQARVAERRWGIGDDVLGGGEQPEALDAEGVALVEAEPEVNPDAEAPEDAGQGEDATGPDGGGADEPEAAEQAEAPAASDEPAVEGDGDPSAEGSAGESEGAEPAAEGGGDPEEDKG